MVCRRASTEKITGVQTYVGQSRVIYLKDPTNEIAAPKYIRTRAWTCQTEDDVSSILSFLIVI